MTVAKNDSSAISRGRMRDRRVIEVWLYIVTLMVVAIIVVGGATRLTDSGLSITEWKPIHGVVPPLNEGQWQEEFAKYQQIPEFRIHNFDMDLDGFKTIFWWEWAHRLLGRTIGVVVLLPLIFFWASRRLEPKLLPRLVILLTLGGLQGAIGWWMVVSGLSERTDVSQYRLAIHLTLAFAILAYALWTARGLRSDAHLTRSGLRLGAIAILAVAFVQVFMGGLVAGLDAGLTFNTWPLMDGGVVPGAAFNLSPWWTNFFDSVATVQWQHRMAAYLLFALSVWHALRARHSPAARGAAIVVILVLLQAAIGVGVLVMVVPVSLALLHQLGAAIVVGALIVHLRAMWPPLPGEGAQTR